MSEDRAEFEARMRRMNAETEKFVAEQRKLIAKSAKFDKERWGFPWLQLLMLVVSSAAIGAVVARLLH